MKSAASIGTTQIHFRIRPIAKLDLALALFIFRENIEANYPVNPTFTR
jgi:hypothetical protein